MYCPIKKKLNEKRGGMEVRKRFSPYEEEEKPFLVPHSKISFADVAYQVDFYVALLSVATAVSLLLAILITVESLVTELLINRYVWLGLLILVSALHAGLFVLYAGSGSPELLSSAPYDKTFFHQYRVSETILCGSYLWCLAVMTVVTFVVHGDSRFKDYLQIQYISFFASLPYLSLCTYYVLSVHFRRRYR